LFATDVSNRWIHQIEIHIGSPGEQLGWRNLPIFVRLQCFGNGDRFGNKAFQPARIQIRRLMTGVAASRIDLYAEALRGRVLDHLQRAVAIFEGDVPACVDRCDNLVRTGCLRYFDGVLRLV